METMKPIRRKTAQPPAENLQIKLYVRDDDVKLTSEQMRHSDWRRFNCKPTANYEHWLRWCRVVEHASLKANETGSSRWAARMRHWEYELKKLSEIKYSWSDMTPLKWDGRPIVHQAVIKTGKVPPEIMHACNYLQPHFPW